MTSLTHLSTHYRDFGQPEGLRESSRGLSAARYPRDRVSIILDPERVTELVWHPFRVPNLAPMFRGVYARCDPRLLSSNPSGCEPEESTKSVPLRTVDHHTC